MAKNNNYQNIDESAQKFELSENEMRLMKDKVTETPSTLEYGHHSGSALIKPEDKGKIKSNALMAMKEQTDTQLLQIQEQVQLLMKQAKAVQDRISISERIYMAEFKNEPLIGKTYYLYEKKDGSDAVSLIGPNEWGRSYPYERHLATARLLADHTWEVSDSSLED